MTHPLWSSLSAVLLRRGYELTMASSPAPATGELARVQLPDGPVTVARAAGAPPPSEQERELIADLVRHVLDPKAAPAPDGQTHLPTVAQSMAAGDFHDLIGRAPAMADLYHFIDRIAASDATSILIQGENGTGKELVARAIHTRSPRRHQPFVATNCSAFNDNLLDSELFGHRRGAFTGASTDKPGLFELADRGTFFLDEIGDMSPSLQAKVLRLLQDGTYYRVGDTEERHADVRVLAATHRDLAAMVSAGEFREDLYYRINVISLVVPPLRERRDDVPLLVERFLRQRCRGQVPELSPSCVQRLTEYPWPGNVRELENEVERLVVLAGGESPISAELLSARIRAAAARPPENPESLPEAVEALERAMIAAALHKHRGNKSRAAQALQVSRRNLIRLVQKYGLDEE